MKRILLPLLVLCSQAAVVQVCHAQYGGYVVTSTAANSVTDVKGSWLVPAVTCNGESQAYLWVGMDGIGEAKGTVEQIGIQVTCINGNTTPTYSAFYEFYPDTAPVPIP